MIYDGSPIALQFPLTRQITSHKSYIENITTMEVQALTRYAHMSPKKMREVARTIQGRKAPEAVDYLTLIPRKSARLIAKTLRSAIANAENNNNLSADGLTVKSAVIENGPVLKRFKAGAKGTAMPRRKKMSHIRIILSDGVASN
jgi:large subunit ribosomal protein L22